MFFVNKQLFGNADARAISHTLRHQMQSASTQAYQHSLEAESTNDWNILRSIGRSHENQFKLRETARNSSIDLVAE